MIFTKEAIQLRSAEKARAQVALLNVYIFPQVRGEESDRMDVDDLLSSIPKKGVLTPPLAAVFDQNGFLEYVHLTNKLHKSSLSAKSYKPNFDGYWLVLIYGHRRFEALKRLQDSFRDEWIENCNTPSGKQSLILLKRGIIVTDLMANPLPNIAKEEQLEENRHRGVAPHVEARIIGEIFQLRRLTNPRLTVVQFIRDYCKGVSEDRVRDALRFYLLPKMVEEAVEKGVIKYGHAVQIGRYLDELKIKKRVEKAWELLGYVINEQPTVSEFAAWISQRIEDARNVARQLDLTELMGEGMALREKIGQHCQVSTGNNLRKLVQHLKGMTFLCQKAMIGLDNSPLRSKTNVMLAAEAMELLAAMLRMFLELTEIVKNPAIPHSRKLLKEIERLKSSRADQVIPIAAKLLDQLEVALNEDEDYKAAVR